MEKSEEITIKMKQLRQLCDDILKHCEAEYFTAKMFTADANSLIAEKKKLMDVNERIRMQNAEAEKQADKIIATAKEHADKILAIANERFVEANRDTIKAKRVVEELQSQKYRKSKEAV